MGWLLIPEEPHLLRRNLGIKDFLYIQCFLERSIFDVDFDARLVLVLVILLCISCLQLRMSFFLNFDSDLFLETHRVLLDTSKAFVKLKQ